MDMLTWARLIIGFVLFASMLFIHAYVKELDLWVMLVPGVLMGVDPSKFFKK